jgi:hypothetical protein
MTLLLALGAALADPPFSAPTDPPVPTDDGDGVREVVATRPVAFTEAYTPSWRADAAPVREGWLVVLSVDPELARPRQTWTPVLYAGDAPLERLYTSPDATCVVGLVTGSQPAPLYFGSTQLPERVTAARGAAELAAARDAGITAQPLPKPGKPLELDAKRLVEMAEAAAVSRR